MGLSTSQFISLILAPLSLVMLVYLRRSAHARSPQKPQGAPPDSEPARASSSRPKRRASASIATSPACWPASRARRFSDSSRTARSRSRGQTVRPTAWSHAGETIVVDIPEPTSPAPQPEALDLDIVYQDPDLVVVNKPAGMVVHPAAGHAQGTLVNALLHEVTDLSGIGGELRPGIVHRLDRGTSGLMVVAKNDRAHAELARQFHDREVEKEYVALVWGVVQAGRRIDLPDRPRSRPIARRCRRARGARARPRRASQSRCTCLA